MAHSVLLHSQGQSESPGDNESAVSSRPYRSHKIPACDFCHRRKTRCVRLRIDEPCILCRSYQMQCETGSAGRTVRRGAVADPKRRIWKHPEPRQVQVPTQIPRAYTKHKQVNSIQKNSERSRAQTQLPKRYSLSTTGPSPGDGSPAITVAPPPPMIGAQASGMAAALNEASHIVGPATARDAQVLEKYISPTNNSIVSHARPNLYSVYSDDPRNPIVYMKVPRRRGIDPSGNGTSGFKQSENIEKILQPFGPDVFSLYFDIIHPSFPILDKRTVVSAYQQDGLPHTLVCEIYAVTLVYWHLSATIRATGRSVPDIRYIWNLTVSAMREDFMQPSLSTVLSSILDLLGRPITSITYNAVNVGSTVALANSLGLNRDPVSWNLDKRQKSLRVRAWWCLLIHDHWASLCHGTPNHIQTDQWDVSLPDLESLAVGSSSDGDFDCSTYRKGAQSFLALCQLTKILGGILPLLYSLKLLKDETCWRFLRKAEAAGDEWEDGLPEFLDPNSNDMEREAPGALNLQLSYLAVKMLVCRVAVQISDPTDFQDMQYHQSRHRKAAKAIIDFVLSLTPADLWVFWLPYAAYHFTSSTILMMRCALEAIDERGARECVACAKSLVDYLRHAKDSSNWDLADICLGQCEAIVEQMSVSSFADLQEKAIPLFNIADVEASLACSSQRAAHYRPPSASTVGGTCVDAEHSESNDPAADISMMDETGITDYMLDHDFF